MRGIVRRSSTDVAIEYDDQGEDEPALLCLPGWCVDRTVFADLVDVCSRTRRTLALDWRGHGGSAAADKDFGEAELLEDALAVIEEANIHQVVPVALAHSGWIAIELRRRLGKRVAAIVFVDWLVLDPPPPFIGALADLQDHEKWEVTRDQLFTMWLQGVESPKVIHLVREVMGSYEFDMWSRGGREIEKAYHREGSPLQALGKMNPSVPSLHLYAQPEDAGFLHAQESFSLRNSWFEVCKVRAKSHFPMLECAEEMANAIETFLMKR